MATLIEGGGVRRQRGLRGRVVLILGLGALMVAAGATGKVAPLSWAYERLLAPAVGSFARAGQGTGDFFQTLSSVRSLARENMELERENAELKGRLAATGDTARENEILRREMGLRAVTAPRQIAAQVVGYQPESFRQFVTLDRGRRDGIRPGMVAMSDGTVVGLISEAAEGTSRLQLASDPQFRLVARDQESGALGLLRGQLGGGLVLEKIAASDQVKPGDTIATSGLGGIPGNLYIGEIQAVNDRKGSIFQSAQITPMRSPATLRFVMVVAGPQ